MALHPEVIYRARKNPSEMDRLESWPLIGKLQITITTGRALTLQLHCTHASGGGGMCVYEEREMVTMP